MTDKRIKLVASWLVVEYHQCKQGQIVMELHWDYDYYQSWTDNEWMVEEMMGIRDEKDKDDAMDNVSAHQDQVGLWT